MTAFVVAFVLMLMVNRQARKGAFKNEPNQNRRRCHEITTILNTYQRGKLSTRRVLKVPNLIYVVSEYPLQAKTEIATHNLNKQS